MIFKMQPNALLPWQSFHIAKSGCYIRCDTTGLLKLAVALVHPRVLSHNLPSPPYLLPYV
jgi:hypothetical protein